MGVAVTHDTCYRSERSQSYDDLHPPTEQFRNSFAANDEADRQKQEDDVFPEGLPIRYDQCIAKAPAIRNRVCNSDIEGEWCHDAIEKQGDPTRPLSAYVQ